MTVKVKLSDISGKIKDRIKKSVEVSVDDEMATELADQIRKRTRLGFGVDENGKQTKLKPLAESYRLQRRGELAFFTDEYGNKIPYEPETKPYLSPYTTPAKSNLTKTGELLDSIRGKAQNGIIFISLEGLRKDGYSNEEIGDFVQSQGRRFLDLTKGEKEELARKVKDKILKNLKD